MSLLETYYNEHAAQARQHEDQREKMTNVVLSVAGVLIGLITFSNLSRWSLPAAGAVVLLGVFGFFASGKHYERFKFHTAIMATIRTEIDRLARQPPGTPSKSLTQLRADGASEHYQNFTWPEFSGTNSGSQARAKSWIARQRTHVFWETVHILVALIGIALCATIAIKWNLEKPPTPTEVHIEE